MELPPWFVNTHHPNHVCQLNKALYGLKQASWAWFQRLSMFLVSNGFSCSNVDTSLFIFKHGECIMYLLEYVDDLILIGNRDGVLQSFITQLHTQFSIKDLGKLNYILGHEVTYINDGYSLAKLNTQKMFLKELGCLMQNRRSLPYCQLLLSHRPLTHIQI